MPVASELLVKVSADTQDAEQGLTRVEHRVSAFAQGAGALGHVATAAFLGVGVAALGLGAGIGAAIGVATDFQAQMSAVGAVSDATGAQMAQLSALAIQLGQDTTLSGVGAADAAKAMEELAKGGVSVQDQLAGGTRGALLLASAGSLDFATAATIAADAMNIFGKTGADIPHIADLFANAANKSSLEVRDIAESMKYVGPVAASMGITIEETTAALAELGAHGIKASEAGTGLRTMMVDLAKPTKAMQGVMAEYGLSFFDAGGHMKSLAGIAGELHTKLGGLTEQQRLSALATLFGKEAVSAMDILYKEGAKGIDDWKDKVTAEGAAAAVGAARNNNLRGSITQLKDSVQTVAITLGTAFLPALRAVTDGLSRAVNAALPFVTALGPRLTAALSGAVPVVAAFGQAILALVRGFASGDFTNAFGPILAAIEAAFGPGSAAKVALFVSDVLTFVQNLRNGAVRLAEGIASGFGAVLGAIGSLLSGQTTLAQFVGGMELFVSAVLGNLGHLATQAAPYLGRFFAAIGAFIAAAAPQLLAQMGQWAGSLVNWIGDTAIPWLLPKLGEFLAAIGTWLAGTALPAVATAAGQLAGALVDWVTTTAVPFLQTNLPLWGAALWDWITGTAVPAVAGAVGGLASALGGWISGAAIPYLTTNLPLWATALTDWITGTAVPAVATTVGNIASALGSFVQQGITDLTTNLPLWSTALTNWIVNTAVPAVAAVIGQVGDALGSFIASAITYLTTNLPLWSTALTNWIINTAVPAVQAVVGQVGDAMGSFIAGAITYLTTNLPLWSTALTNWIINTAVPAVQNVIGQVGDALASFIPGAILTVQAGLVEWDAAVSDHIVRESAPGITGASLANLPLALNSGLVAASGESGTHMETWYEGIIRFLEPLPAQITAILVPLGHALGEWIGEAIPGLLANLSKYSAILFAGPAAWALALAVATTRLAVLLWSWIGDAIGPTAAGIARWAGTVVTAVAGLGVALLNAAYGMVGALIAAGQAIGKGIVDGIVNGILGGRTRVASAAASLADAAPAGAKGALQEKSPSKVMEAIGMFAVEGLIIGLDAGKQDAAKKAAEVASAIAKAITDVLGASRALAKLNLAADIPTGGQIGAFSGVTVALVASIQAAAAHFSEEGLKAAGAFADAASKVGGSITAALTGLKALAGYDFAKDSPTGSALGWFAHLAVSLVATFAAAGVMFNAEALKVASDFADAAGKVGGSVAATLAGLKALAGASWADSAPSGSALGWFTHLAASLVQNFVAAAADFADGGLKAAGEFADATAKVLGTVKAALDVFKGLATYADPPRANLYAFGKTLRATMNDFALIAAQVTQEAAASAATFADGAGHVVAALGAGVAAFEKLRDYADPPRAAIYAFGKTLRATINDFALLAAQITPEATAAAATFADGAGKVVAILGTGVAGFAALSTFVAPAASAIYDFGKTLRAIINDFALIAAQVTQDAADAAAKFAEGAGKVVALLGNGVKGLMDLNTFVAPSKVAIDNFVNAVNEMVARIAMFAAQIGTDGLKAADLFGTAAGKIVSAVSTGLADFKEMGKVAPPSAQAMDDLAIAIKYMVEKFAAIATDMGSAALTHAQAFGAAVTGTFSALKSGLDILGSLEKYKDLPVKVLGEVLAGLRRGLETMRDLQGAANAYVQQADTVLGTMRTAAAKLAEALSIGAGLPRDFGAIGNAVGTDFATGVRDSLAIRSPSGVMAEVGTQIIAGLVQGLDAAQQEAAKKAAEVATAVAQAVTATLGAFAGLSAFKAPPVAAIYALGKSIMAAVNDFAVIAEQVAGTGKDALATFTATTVAFAEGAGKVVATIATGVAAFAALGTFVAPAQSGVLAFGKALRGVVNDMALIAEQVTQGAADQAAKFAESAGKVVGIIAGAVTGFKALDGFAPPLGTAMAAFTRAIADFMAGFVVAVAPFATGALTQAGVFADAAGKAVGIVANGVAGFKALDGFAAPLGSSIAAFVGSLADFMAQFTTHTGGFAEAALKQSSVFADAAGKAVGIVAGAVTGFKALAGFTAPLGSSVAAFVESLADFMAHFTARIGPFAADALKQAGVFADAAGKAVGIIATGVAGFKALADFNAPATASLDAFARTVGLLMARMQTIAVDFRAEGLTSAGLFADAAGKVLGIVANGVAGFAALLSFVAPPLSAIDAFAAAVRGMVARFADLAATLNADGLTAANAFAAAATNIFGALSSAVSYFKGLDGLLLPDAGGIARLLAPILATLTAVRDAAGTLGAGGLDAAAHFAQTVSTVFGALEQSQRTLSLAGGGGGGGTGGGGSGGGGNITVAIYGNVYGAADLEDQIVAAVVNAQRRGRL